MKYTYHTIDKIIFIEVENELGLKVVFCPVGASIKSIVFDGKLMNITPKDVHEFLNPANLLGKTLGPVFDKKEFSILGKKYELNEAGEKYNCSNFIYQSKPYLDKNIFSITYTFQKKKMSDGLPGKVQYFITYSMSDKSNELLIDYRAKSNDFTPMSLSSGLLFNLTSESKDDLLFNLSSKEILNSGNSFVLEENNNFEKKKKISSLSSNEYLFKSTKEQKMSLENAKYRLEITSFGYPLIKVLLNQRDDYYYVTPQDNPLSDNVIVRGELYHRQILYNFIKK